MNSITKFLIAAAAPALSLAVALPAQAVTSVTCSNASKSVSFSLGADSPWFIADADCAEGNVSGTDTSVIEGLFGGTWNEKTGVLDWNVEPVTTASTGLQSWEFEFLGDIYPLVTIVLKQADFFAAFKVQLDVLAVGSTLSPIVTGTWGILQANPHGSPTSENSISHTELFYSGIPFDPTDVEVGAVPVPLGLPLIASAFGLAWMVRRTRSNA